MRLRVRHYWRHRLRQGSPERFEAVICDAPRTIGMLSTKPQAALSWFDRVVAILTTPFKRLGISGWIETGCIAVAGGRPVRDAQHSTDGFWTIDIRLDLFRIGATGLDPGQERYLRLEVEPETAAHEVCATTPILAGVLLSFGGAVVIDTDGPYLEVHPEEDFQIVGAG